MWKVLRRENPIVYGTVSRKLFLNSHSKKTLGPTHALKVLQQNFIVIFLFQTIKLVSLYQGIPVNNGPILNTYKNDPERQFI